MKQGTDDFVVRLRIFYAFSRSHDTVPKSGNTTTYSVVHTPVMHFSLETPTSRKFVKRKHQNQEPFANLHKTLPII